MCGWTASKVVASGVTGRVAPVVEAASGGSELWGDIHPLSGELRAVPQNSNATWTAGLLRVMTGRRRIRRRGAVAVGHHFAAERFAVIAHEWPGLFERTVYRSACGTLAFHLRQSPCRTTITVWIRRAGRFVSLLADRALHFVPADLIVRWLGDQPPVSETATVIPARGATGLSMAIIAVPAFSSGMRSAITPRRSSLPSVIIASMAG